MVHGEKGFYIAVAAVWHGCHEHIGWDNFTGVCVNNSGSIAGPIHLHNLTGFVVQVHGGVDLCQIVGIVLAELGGLVWNLARRPAPVAVFQPQQGQCNTAALEFLVDIFFRRRGGLARIMPDMSGTAYGFRMGMESFITSIAFLTNTS